MVQPCRRGKMVRHADIEKKKKMSRINNAGQFHHAAPLLCQEPLKGALNALWPELSQCHSVIIVEFAELRAWICIQVKAVKRIVLFHV